MIDRVDLGRDLEDYVQRLAASHRFDSVDSVLRESVRLLELRESKLAELNAAIDAGLDDVRAGRLVPLDEAFAHVEEKLESTFQNR